MPPSFQRSCDHSLKLGGELDGLRVELVANQACAPSREFADQLFEGVVAELDTLLDQFCRQRLQRDSGLLHLRHHLLGCADVFFEALPHLPVIAEGIQRCRRDRVDGIGRDQLFDIEYVAVARVLGPGARPAAAARAPLACSFSQRAPANRRL